MRVFTIMGISLAIYGCSTDLPPFEDKTTPVVSRSAQGWTLKPGPKDPGSEFTTTIVVNPKGKEFNIGVTRYPSFLPATLWIVEVKELRARFLFIRVPPVASGAVEMPVLYIDSDDIPSVSGLIRQRFEFDAYPDDAAGYDPKIMWDGEHRLRDFLFEDSDKDGIPELVESLFWKESGTVTYFRFNKDKTFSPLWKEEWEMGDNSYERISRTRVKP